MSLKTSQNAGSVKGFIKTIDDQQKRKDSEKLLDLFRRITGDEGSMWGTAIIGFGAYTYKRSDGKEYQWMATGFSPRKQNLTLYIMPGYDQYQDELNRLGKHKIGKSCLYIKKLEDIDLDVLAWLITDSFKRINGSYVDYNNK